MARKKKSKNIAKWKIALFVTGVAAAITWAVPDPLPLIDEIVLTAVALLSGYKVVMEK